MTNESAEAPGMDASAFEAFRVGREAGRKTAALTLGLVVVSIAAAAAFVDIGAAPLVSGLAGGWLAIVLITIVSEFVPVHIDVRRATYSFTLSEVPMVIGLFFTSPRDLIVGRLIGEALVLVVRERQHVRKVALNLATCLAGTVAVLLSFDALGRPADVERPLTWLAALAAVVVSCVVSYVSVNTVLRWHGAPSSLLTMTLTGLLTVPANTALGLVAAVLLTTTPWATLLLSGMLLMLVASYRASSRLSEKYASLELLHDFTRLVGGARSPDAVLEAILEHSKELLVSERAEIWLEDDGRFVGLEVGPHGRTEVNVPPKARELLTRWFAESLDARIGSVTDHRGDRLIAEVLHCHDCVVAPITEGGAVVGMIAVVDRTDKVEGFRPRDAKLCTTLAAHASAALENGRLIRRLHDEARTREHESLHDPLTGLPNRVLFARRLRDELDAADLGHRPGPVVGLLDLDDFKLINDSLGHHWGDHALVEVAKRLTDTAGPAVTVARLGGDEFALLAPAWSMVELDGFAARLRRSVTDPLVLGGRRLSIGISIGLAAYDGTGDDGAVLMRRADAAMYRAKQQTKAGGGVGYALARAGEGLGDR